MAGEKKGEEEKPKKRRRRRSSGGGQGGASAPKFVKEAAGALVDVGLGVGGGAVDRYAERRHGVKGRRVVRGGSVIAYLGARLLLGKDHTATQALRGFASGVGGGLGGDLADKAMDAQDKQAAEATEKTAQQSAQQSAEEMRRSLREEMDREFKAELARLREERDAERAELTAQMKDLARLRAQLAADLDEEPEPVPVKRRNRKDAANQLEAS